MLSTFEEFQRTAARFSLVHHDYEEKWQSSKLNLAKVCMTATPRGNLAVKETVKVGIFITSREAAAIELMEGRLDLLEMILHKYVQRGPADE